jgi:hypothetical protein
MTNSIGSGTIIEVRFVIGSLGHSLVIRILSLVIQTSYFSYALITFKIASPICSMSDSV